MIGFEILLMGVVLATKLKFPPFYFKLLAESYFRPAIPADAASSLEDFFVRELLF